MPDYQKMYYSLFNDVTDTITKLQQAQQKTEQLYMDSQKPPLTAEKKPIILLNQEHPSAKGTPPKKKPPSHDER